MFVDQYPELRSHGYGALRRLDPRSRHYAARCFECVDPLIRDEGERNRHFTEGSKALLAAITMHLRRKDPNATLYDVRRALTSPTLFENGDPASGFLHLLSEMMNSPYQPVSNLAGRLVERLTDKNSQSTSAQDIRDTAINNTTWLDDPAMVEDLKGPGIDFQRMRREIMTVYVVLPFSEVPKKAPWIQVILSQALNELYRTPLNELHHLPPVCFLLEEFAQLSPMDVITAALGTARDSRIRLWPFLQDIAQLRRRYPQIWGNFFTGSGLITTYAPRDWETAEFFAKMCGTKSEAAVSINQGADGRPGMTEAQHAYPLIRPEELRALPRNVMLTMCEPEPNPFFTLTLPYSQTRFGRNLDPNPYYRP